MLTFYMVRHGETLFNRKHLMQGWCDSPLTTEAIEKAKALGERLAGVGFEAVYASTSERAWKTAEYIIQANHQPKRVVMKEDLKEIHFGIMEGENEYVGRIANMEKYHQFGWLDDGGESKEMLLDRVLSCLHHICQEHQEGNILVVSHGVVMMHLLKELDPELIETQPQPFHIENLAVMKVVWDGTKFKILEINASH